MWKRSADPLDEADVFLAYGRNRRAIEVLEKAIRLDPSRQDLRTRLDEVRRSSVQSSAQVLAPGEQFKLGLWVVVAALIVIVGLWGLGSYLPGVAFVLIGGCFGLAGGAGVTLAGALKRRLHNRGRVLLVLGANALLLALAALGGFLKTQTPTPGRFMSWAIAAVVVGFVLPLGLAAFLRKRGQSA